MFSTGKTNLLLRSPDKLPIGLRLLTEKFHEDWALARSMDACRLGKEVQACGWNFVKIADGAIAAGVGDTSQEAVASALRLALRRISEHSNAVEIKRVEFTQYQWFFLARVGICPYRIQKGAELPSIEMSTPPIAFLRKRWSRPSAAYCPLPDSTVPLLKTTLVLSRSTIERRYGWPTTSAAPVRFSPGPASSSVAGLRG